jgi:hypothetical protein
VSPRRSPSPAAPRSNEHPNMLPCAREARRGAAGECGGGEGGGQGCGRARVPARRRAAAAARRAQRRCFSATPRRTSSTGCSISLRLRSGSCTKAHCSPRSASGSGCERCERCARCERSRARQRRAARGWCVRAPRGGSTPGAGPVLAGRGAQQLQGGRLRQLRQRATHASGAPPGRTATLRTRAAGLAAVRVCHHTKRRAHAHAQQQSGTSAAAVRSPLARPGPAQTCCWPCRCSVGPPCTQTRGAPPAALILSVLVKCDKCEKCEKCSVRSVRNVV